MFPQGVRGLEEKLTSRQLKPFSATMSRAMSWEAVDCFPAFENDLVLVPIIIRPRALKGYFVLLERTGQKKYHSCHT
jgi:hypothetical protein